MEGDRLSDLAIFDHILEPVLSGDPDLLDAVYEAFEPVDEARNAAALRMLAGAAIAFLSTFGILATDNAVSGLRIEPAFFSVVPVGYTTLCYLQLTDADLKRRLYERLFAQVFDRLDEADRGRVALLYPKAFPGSLYTAARMKPRDMVVGGGQALGLSAVIAGFAGSAAASVVLWLYMLAMLWGRASGSATRIVHATIVVHLVVVMLIKTIHRDPNKLRRYVTVAATGVEAPADR